MAWPWVSATRKSSGEKLWINMDHVGLMIDAKDGDGVAMTSIEVDQDYINVIEPIDHFLPKE